MGQVDSARYYIQMGDSVRSPYIDQDLSLANFYLVQKTLMNYIDSRSFTIRMWRSSQTGCITTLSVTNG